MRGFNSLLSSLFLASVNGATTYTDVRGTGSYTEGVYPLCQENELFVTYEEKLNNAFKADYGV